MRPEQVREHLYREPFQPFRVRVSDGRTYEIRQPHFNLIGESIFIIGVPAPDDPNPRVPDLMDWVPLKMIVGIDPLPESAPSAAK